MGRTEIIDRATAHRMGITDRALQKHCAEGELIRLRPGVYMPWNQGRNRVEHHAAAVHAAVQALAAPAVVSHASAAVLHGLQLWDVALTKVHMTRPGSEGGTTSGIRRLHVGPLTPEDITTVDGVAVTTVARTVVDVARTADFTRAVAVGDSALNSALTTPDALHDAVDRVRGRNGARRAAAAVRFMDARSESPGESWSRVQMDRGGLPRPELQSVIRCEGRFLARSDFHFRRLGIVGEFDGRIKYAGGDPSAAVGADGVLYREKRREDALRHRGLVVLRWGWADLRIPGRLRLMFSEARELAEALPAPRIDPPDPRDTYRPRPRQ